MAHHLALTAVILRGVYPEPNTGILLPPRGIRMTSEGLRMTGEGAQPDCGSLMCSTNFYNTTLVWRPAVRWTT
jgi:hypothetical protein